MARIVATLLVWVMFTVIVISLLTSVTGAITNASGSEVFGIVVAIAAAAAISTAAIWAAGAHNEDDDESMARLLAKVKRRRPRRAEELLESLDDEEIYDLEALLLSRSRETRQPPS